MKGDAVITQGDTGSSLFVILDGVNTPRCETNFFLFLIAVVVILNQFHKRETLAIISPEDWALGPKPYYISQGGDTRNNFPRGLGPGP
jgi:hypothetical protein